MGTVFKYIIYGLFWFWVITVGLAFYDPELYIEYITWLMG